MCYRIIISFFLILVIITSCDDSEKSEDPLGINYNIVESVNGIVVDTQIGWTILSENYGFLELIEPLDDSLLIDGLKVRIEINRGDTYENKSYYRDFTHAKVIRAELNPLLFTQAPVIIEILWSPDESDDIRTYPDGYGYAVTVSESSFKIRQPHFPGIGGLGTFRTEIEAFKTGALVAHLLLSQGGLPSTGVPVLDFLKIDWYE
jgi:hypothetical protein